MLSEASGGQRTEALGGVDGHDDHRPAADVGHFGGDGTRGSSAEADRAHRRQVRGREAHGARGRTPTAGPDDCTIRSTTSSTALEGPTAWCAGCERRPLRAAAAGRRAPTPRPSPAGGRAVLGTMASPMAVDRQRGEEPHTVDLGGGGEAGTHGRGGAVEAVTQRGAGRPRGAARARRARPSRRGGGRASGCREGCGEHEVFLEERLRWPAPGRRQGGASTAASSPPAARRGRSEAVVAELTTRRTRGCSSRSRSSSGGRSQRAVVGMTPRRASPATSVPRADRSARSASSSASTRRARATTTWPASVSSRPVAVVEGGVQLPLELGHVRRDVRLHREQGVRGRGERSVVGHGHERGELAKVHGGPQRSEIRVGPSPKVMVPIGNKRLRDGLGSCILSLVRGGPTPKVRIDTSPHQAIPPIA